MLKARLNDGHPRVRLEALRAASYFGNPELAESVLDVLNYDTDDSIEYVLGGDLAGP